MSNIDNLVTIFKNDTLLQEKLKKYYVLKDIEDYVEEYSNYVTTYNETILYSLAELLLENETYIYNTTINDLLLESFLKSDINKIFNITINEELLHQIFYSFKYSNIKSFFYNNYNKFLPEIDIIKIKSKEKIKLFQESLMAEFDKLSSIIEEVSYLQDIDEVPTEYLEYLSQLLGYEKEETVVVNDEKYRILIKNIVELYKIKGTNYSLELFFNFLGYNIEVLEYWFDRRYINYIYNQNPFTGETDNSNFTYYLTPYDPTETLPGNVYPTEYVSKGEISKQLNVFNFNLLSQTYDPEVLLGYKKNYGNIKYTGDTFKFFKTNVMEFKISILPNSTTLTGEKELQSLRKYIEFLTPINVIKFITFSSLYPEEDMGYQVINGVQLRALMVGEKRIFTDISVFSDDLGDPRKIYGDDINDKLIYQYSTDYSPANPELATWSIDFTVSPVWIRMSIDNGSTWGTPMNFNTNDIVENTLFFDNENNVRGSIKEKIFNAFIILPREPTNELSNLSSYFSLASSNGRLHSNSSSRKVSNDNQQQQFNIEKIVWNNGTYTEVWIIKPYSTFNPLRGTINQVELCDLIDKTQEGIYNIVSTRTETVSSKTYFVLVITKIILKKDVEGTGNQLFGGTVSFITNDGYPFYSITKTNERGNSVIKIVNPYPRKIPNFIPYSSLTKTIMPSYIYLRYTETSCLCINKYKIKRFFYTQTTSPTINYLNIETEQITELPSDILQSGLNPKGLVFIDKDRWSLGKKKHDLLDDNDFRWFKTTS